MAEPEPNVEKAPPLQMYVETIRRTYLMSDAEKKSLDTNFMYHPPKPGQAERYQEIRMRGRVMAFDLLCLCPPCPERSAALLKLEEAVMWANAAIARNE